MVRVICRDGQFLVKGSFFMGNAGTLENKSYDDDNITIESELEDIVDDPEKDYYWMAPLKPLLEHLPKDGDSVAKMYENYINGMEEKIKKNVKQVNDYYWYELLEHLTDCEFPFWEVDEAISPPYREKCTEAQCREAYRNEELRTVLPKLYEEFHKIPNDGTVEKTDVEALIRRVFPMFDLDSLTAAITPDCLYIEGGLLQLQFTDCWDSSFFCSATVKFDDTLTPLEWDNF